jgi:hypothetical protein
MTDGITLKSLAPILIVDAIGPSLPFWTDRLGFAVVAARCRKRRRMISSSWRAMALR